MISKIMKIWNVVAIIYIGVISMLSKLSYTPTNVGVHFFRGVFLLIPLTYYVYTNRTDSNKIACTVLLVFIGVFWISLFGALLFEIFNHE